MNITHLTDREVYQLRAIGRRDGLRTRDDEAEASLIDQGLAHRVIGGALLTTKGQMLVAFGRC